MRGTEQPPPAMSLAISRMRLSWALRDAETADKCAIIIVSASAVESVSQTRSSSWLVAVLVK